MGEKIAEKPLRFSEYFEAWIRAYYASVPLGRDFYTAVSASKFFGGAIAKYILQSLESGAIRLPLNIIDLGANNANLLNDIRAFLETLGVGVAEHCNFIAVESNAKITHKITHPLAPSARAGESVKFYKNLAELKSANLLQNNHNIFIANEFFDALPCEIIDNGNIAFVENNRLIFKSCDDKKVLEICKNFKIHKGEIPLSYDKFCDEIKSLKFIFIAFDYGDIAPRNDFSLRLFYKHKIQNFADIALDSAKIAESQNLDISSQNLAQNSQNPLDSASNSQNLATLFGKCDITYSVPFFILDSAFEAIGAKKILSKRQDLALIEDFGILDLLQDFYNAQKPQNPQKSQNLGIYLRESNKIKTLLYELSPRFCAVIYTNL